MKPDFQTSEYFIAQLQSSGITCLMKVATLLCALYRVVLHTFISATLKSSAPLIYSENFTLIFFFFFGCSSTKTSLWPGKYPWPRGSNSSAQQQDTHHLSGIKTASKLCTYLCTDLL